MITREQICAELYFILNQTPYSYIKLLPSELLNNLKIRMSIEWYNKFNPDKVFTKQKFDNKTLKLLEEIRTKYWYQCG